MEQTYPIRGEEYGAECYVATTDEIITGLQLRLKNLKRAHKRGNVRALVLEAEEAGAALFVLRHRHDLLVQMLDG